MSSSLHHQLAHAGPPSALPHPLPSALDLLVDRLNASSGYSPSSSSSSSDATSPPPPIRALLIGTNEGAPLHRSFGTGNQPHGLSEEILASVESMWATLPSSAPPHVMAAAQAADAAASAALAATTGESAVVVDGDSAQPPHPLLRPLGLGDEIRTVTAFYDTSTLVHVHMSPLVVTILTTPSANIGSIRTIALPLLKELLLPVRRSILVSRREALTGLGGTGVGGGSVGGAAIGPGGAAVGSTGGLNSTAMEEAFAAGFRAGSFPRGGAVPYS